MSENEAKIEGTIKKILVVDDDAQIRNLLYRILTKEKYQVTTVPSGAMAMETLKKDRPDLILLDQRMPEMDGLQTLKKIREFDKEVAIVMLTGYGTGELEINALKLGASDFLMKGIPAVRLLKAVEEVIARQKMFAVKKETEKKTGGKVMVVDDDAQIRKLIEKFLQKHNHEVRTASSGEEALKILKSGDYQPEVAVLDINMPGMDGLIALQEIRKLNKGISVIMMTGADEPALRQQALELGALDCLAKPLNLKHLELTIRIRGLGQPSSTTG